ncbi:4-(cytidine 5'-diphospho)-2-C-methyl-D-erythritol kinase [Kiloniella laminariae]|uniref:4-diphosphocytidyl-2-C-methyl-D-erythritol kinase n=1 Tax=Kiloniella laminariae TaxID=454162 RepID=A0ABT4LL66_9PROT|nr:4-(cytidine 5'-diphospho)-2-C-methyl-D-erythritol kinase [Kiloniella laminariae]MCZ4281819.1 4-(cytidine 5'-diphospho)-2-C-methyl-D-erythritol kinase [Kiloniella laminariae]
MEYITEFAAAKINLTLQVTGKRSDGYHMLQSLVVFAGVGDYLRFSPAEDLSLEITGPFASSLTTDPNNLVLAAARKLQEQLGKNCASQTVPGAVIRLEKNLPVASGIGGGSADAAAALRGLLRLWEADLPESDLTSLALELGADVPVCLSSSCRWMEGIGEVLTPGPELPKLFAVLVNPGVPVSTPGVFKALKGNFMPASGKPSAIPALAELIGYLENTPNDLQAPAISQRGIVSEVLTELRGSHGCLFSAMSGSGATCYGLFDTAEDAESAATTLSVENPGWWVAPTFLR